MSQDELDALAQLQQRKPKLRMHCVYCGATIPCQSILYVTASPEEQERRMAFELHHDEACGPKSVGMIGDFEEDT